MKTDNLFDKEAIEKIKSLAKETKVAMLLTNLTKLPIHVNPMTTKKVDDDGAIWFLSPLNSDHNINIQANNKVQLLYSDTDKKQYLSVYGEASIKSHHNILEELYTKEDNKWFDGFDDSNLTAIKVTPIEAYYWDNSRNKFISMLEGTVEAVTGENNEHYKKGTIEVD
tara:strand:+ start:56533 stop:57036 length:504 start_codon:yes stop_codon:yes gene_type:complete